MALSEGRALQVEKIGKCKHPHAEACLTCPKKSKEVMEAEGEKKECRRGREQGGQCRG